MFCVLTVKQRNDTEFERLFGNFIKDSYSVLTVPVPHGAPFYHLTATVGKRGVDFERVIYETGRCAQRLLINDSVKLPQIRGIGEYNSDLLCKLLISNTADVLMKEIGEKAVFDEKNGIITYCGNTVEICRDRNDFNYPKMYYSLKPDSIEKYKFAAALYELCGVFSIGGCCFNSVLVNGEKKSISDIYFS